MDLFALELDMIQKSIWKNKQPRIIFKNLKRGMKRENPKLLKAYQKNFDN